MVADLHIGRVRLLLLCGGDFRLWCLLGSEPELEERGE
jgi:hypothetical protein